MKNDISFRVLFVILFLGFIFSIIIARQVVKEVAIVTNTLNQDETAISVHPEADTLLFATWNAQIDTGTGMRVGYSFSTNGGITWKTPDILPPLTWQGVSQMRGGDPSCAFDDSIYAYCCFIAYNREMSATPDTHVVYVARTSDLGDNWDFYPVTDTTNYEYKGNDRPYMTVDNTDDTTTIYVTWMQRFNYAPSYDYYIKVSNSSDFGESWSEPLVLEHVEQEDHLQVCQPRPAIGIDGTLYIIWGVQDKEPDPMTVEYKITKSTDGGDSFFDTTSVATMPWTKDSEGYIRYNPGAVIATDQTDEDLLYIAFLCQDEGDQDPNIYFTKSTNKGANWSNPQVLIDRELGVQYHPSLSCSPDGTIYLMYGHLTLDEHLPSEQDSSVYIYVALSVDQGETFLTPNIRVNSIPSSPYREDSYYSPRGNDYQGITSTSGKAFPCWTDYRNEVVKNEDIYCAIVDVFRSGDIDSDETWSQLVVLTGDVTVEDTIILTIEIDTSTTNTTIYALSDCDDQADGLDTTKCELIVAGYLEALGIDSSKVVNFISTEVDTFPAGWYGIRLSNGPDSLYWCEIEDAYIGVRSEASVSDVLNCSFIANELSGIGSSPGSDLLISECLFQENGEYGIGLLRPDYAEITGNAFYDNSDYGIYITAGDDAESEISISGNIISLWDEQISHDYGIFFKLVDNGSDDPTYLEIIDQNDISDCLQAGIRVEALANLTSLDSSSVIDSNLVVDNYNGIEISVGKNLVLRKNEITDNDNKGVLSSYHYPILGDDITGEGGSNTIYDNGVYDVYLSNSNPYNPLKAENNWWGSSSGPDSTKIYGNIDFNPWLTSAP
jgi:hypothetical protein